MEIVSDHKFNPKSTVPCLDVNNVIKTRSPRTGTSSTNDTVTASKVPFGGGTDV